MRVVVLSDTHAPRRWKSCPPAVAEHLRHALLGEVAEAPAHLLDLQRVLQVNTAEDLRSEIGQPGEGNIALLGQRVADA